MFWLPLALQVALPNAAPTVFDLNTVIKPKDIAVVDRCFDPIESIAIVVCGRRSERNRLPLPIERLPSDRIRDAAGSGIAALTPSGRCGIFAGERHCSKREAAEYGYGNGRDPISLVTRLAEQVADPDGN